MDRILTKLLIGLIISLLITSCRTEPSEHKSKVISETDVTVNSNSSQNSATTINSCELLPTFFSSYSEALYQVKNADFEIEDKFRPGLGKWIDQFAYYSCDGSSGYLIMETKGKEYIHQGLPLSKWKELKNAESAGSYYVKQIKGNYRLQPR